MQTGSAPAQVVFYDMNGQCSDSNFAMIPEWSNGLPVGAAVMYLADLNVDGVCECLLFDGQWTVYFLGGSAWIEYPNTLPPLGDMPLGFADADGDGDNDIFTTASLWYNLSPSPVSPGSGGAVIPSEVSLSAYPNPFNATTTITYSLPASGAVELRVYDVTGRLAKTLVDEVMSAGTHSMSVDGSALASGVYFARLQAADQVGTQKTAVVEIGWTIEARKKRRTPMHGTAHKLVFFALVGLMVSLAYAINYQYHSNIEVTVFGDRIKFWHEDTLAGPIRSNDQIAIMENPVFYDFIITTAEDFWRGIGYNPGIPESEYAIFNAPELPLPTDAGEIRLRAYTQGYFLMAGPEMQAWVRIRHDTLRVSWAVLGQPFDSSVYEDILLTDPATVFFDATLRISGTVSTELVLGASGGSGWKTILCMRVQRCPMAHPCRGTRRSSLSFPKTR